MASVRVSVDFTFRGTDERAADRFAWLAEALPDPTTDNLVLLADSMGLELSQIQACLESRLSRPVWAS